MELAECCEMFDVMKDLGHYSGIVILFIHNSHSKNRGCRFWNI